MQKLLVFKITSAFLIVMLVLMALPVNPAFAADTGWYSPVNCNSVSVSPWRTPNYALSSDNLYATVDSDNSNLVCSFNLPAIPAGNVISGIEVSYEGYTTDTRQADNVQLSWNGGTSYSLSAPTTTLTAIENTYTLGNASDTWGRSWTIGDFTSNNFKVRFQSNAGTGVSTDIIHLNHIQVRVSYSQAEINIQGNGLDIADGDSTPRASDGSAFGRVGQGISANTAFTIQNLGTSDLTLGTITMGGSLDFSVTTSPVSPVPAGGSTTFIVTYHPTTTGAKTATISIANNDDDENPYDFSLSGTGVATGSEADIQYNGVTIGSGDASPSLIDGTNLGSVALGSSATLTYTIRNLGAATLNLGTITIGGTVPGDFSYTGPVSTTVAAGNSTTFTLTFTPTATGNRDATFSIVTDDANESPYDF